LFLRWLHIASTIVVAGTLLALRVLLLPSLSILPSEQATQLTGRLMPRVRRAIWIGLFVLFTSGVIEVFRTSVIGQGLGRGRYFGALIAKLALATLLLGVLRLALVAPDHAWFPRLQPKRRALVTASLLLATLITIISAYLHSLR
jgi:uncharacterized membrane protein